MEKIELLEKSRKTIYPLVQKQEEITDKVNEIIIRLNLLKEKEDK